MAPTSPIQHRPKVKQKKSLDLLSRGFSSAAAEKAKLIWFPESQRTRNQCLTVSACCIKDKITRSISQWRRVSHSANVQSKRSHVILRSLDFLPRGFSSTVAKKVKSLISDLIPRVTELQEPQRSVEEHRRGALGLLGFWCFGVFWSVRKWRR